MLFLAIVIAVYCVLMVVFVNYVRKQRELEYAGHVNAVTNSASVLDQQMLAMRIMCNPLNIPYRYQFSSRIMDGAPEDAYRIFREAADPSLIGFKGKYYLFPSMTAGFLVSEDLCHWERKEFLNRMPGGSFFKFSSFESLPQ